MSVTLFAARPQFFDPSQWSEIIFFNDQDRYRFYLLRQEGVERFRHRIKRFKKSPLDAILSFIAVCF